jgi:hypothetical protein
MGWLVAGEGVTPAIGARAEARPAVGREAPCALVRGSGGRIPGLSSSVVGGVVAHDAAHRIWDRVGRRKSRATSGSARAAAAPTLHDVLPTSSFRPHPGPRADTDTGVQECNDLSLTRQVGVAKRVDRLGPLRIERDELAGGPWPSKLVEHGATGENRRQAARSMHRPGAIGTFPTFFQPLAEE